MKKNKYIVLLILLYVFFRFDYIRLDGFSGELWSVFLHSDTKYSKGYSHKKFSEIKVGMSESQVIKILGEPINKWENNFTENKPEVGFTYSISPGDTNYRIRIVYFKEGKVSSIIHYFYLD